MRSIESEGDTIDEAIENALSTLNARREQVEVEILCDATRTLFGLRGKRARVRASMRAPLSPSLDGGSTSNVPRETERETAPSRTPPGAPETAPSFGARSREVLEGILLHLGASCRIQVQLGAQPGEVMLAVSGEDSGLLIGRRGQTLDAIEYLLNRIVGRGSRVLIDVERYRERRREYLDTLARRLASKVKETGRVITLNPLSPGDRRIVHLALQDDTEITTRSQGDGHYRKMLILPASNPARPRGTTRSPN
jgi:spoIIIJ-associated protein